MRYVPVSARIRCTRHASVRPSTTAMVSMVSQEGSEQPCGWCFYPSRFVGRDAIALEADRAAYGGETRNGIKGASLAAPGTAVTDTAARTMP
jgi:hypothetical protein